MYWNIFSKHVLNLRVVVLGLTGNSKNGLPSGDAAK